MTDDNTAADNIRIEVKRGQFLDVPATEFIAAVKKKKVLWLQSSDFTTHDNEPQKNPIISDAWNKLGRQLSVEFLGYTPNEAQLSKIGFDLSLEWAKIRKRFGTTLYTLVLRPVPSACKASWSRFLHLLYSYNSQLLDKKKYSDAAQIVAYLDAESDKLQSEGDYKFILCIYGTFLLKQAVVAATSTTSSSDESTTSASLASVLHALARLFAAMLRQSIELNFTYPQLVTDFKLALYSKKASASIFRVHATQLPAAPKIAMFDAFFALLAGHRQPELPASERCAVGQAHIETLHVLLQVDAQNCLREPQVALRHLRIVRDLQLLQQDDAPAMSYTLKLLYFYVKLVWTSAVAKVERFAHTYVEVCAKFASFFRKSGEALVQQRWFLDLLVALHVLLAQMMLPAGRAAIDTVAAAAAATTSPSASSPFDAFWAQLSVECYAAHFELIVACVQLAPYITETKLVAWPCCTSVRKHIILSFAMSAFSAYSTFVLTCEEQAQSESSEALNESFTLILRHALNALSQMACINVNSSEVQTFYARFSQLTRDVRTPRQARFCLTLAEHLPKARSKFSAAQWRFLLRRFYQTAALGGDANATNELQSHYIAAELQSHFSDNNITLSGDFTSVRKQIATFYVAPPETAPLHDKCLLALHEASRSVLKPVLEPLQKRLLYWLDAQYVFRYSQLATAELQASLQRCAPTQYELVWVLRAAGSSKEQNASADTLKKLCRALTCKAAAAPLQRLDQLCLAHAYTLLLHERNDAQKKSRATGFEIKATSEYLEQLLLQRKEFQAVTVAAEMQLIQLAVEAQQAFAEFYNKADEEPITSDEAYIDWEFIVEDLAALANFLDYSGCLEYANQTWLLHYRIASTIADDYSALRSLAFLCEHVDQYHDHNNNNNNNAPAALDFDLSAEVAGRLPSIVEMLQALPTLRERHQSWLLCCCCQLAHFYAYAGNFTYAETLLDLVQLKQHELPSRRGKFDLVLGTVGVVQFRILWKQQQTTTSTSADESGASTSPLMQEYVLRTAEQTLNSFHQFVSLSSSDHIGYTILIFNFINQLTECLANRMCDHFSEGVLLSVFRMAVQAGAALRMVQILIMYMLINVQMEELAKAKSNSKIIEYIMGIKTLAQLTKSNTSATNDSLAKEQSAQNSAKESTVSEMISLQLNPSMEMMRKVVQVHISPIKMDKMRLSPMARYCDLKHFLRWQPNTNKTLTGLNEMLKWTYFATGCMNARIHFLAGEYTQLEEFFETCIKWWQQRQQKKNDLLVRTFQPFYLLSMQHYANCLRAQKKYSKAVQCLEITLEQSARMAGNVDTVYAINLGLQLRNSNVELSLQKSNATANGCIAKSMFQDKPAMRRALKFEIASDNDLKATPQQKSIQKRGEELAPATSITKKTTKPKYVPRKVSIIISKSKNDQKSHRSPALPQPEATPQLTSSSSKKLTTIPKEPSLDPDLCQVIEIIELDDTSDLAPTPVPAKNIPNKIVDPASNRKRTLKTPALTSKAVELTPPPLFSMVDLVNASESAQKSKIVSTSKKQKTASPPAELNVKINAMKISSSSRQLQTLAQRKCVPQSAVEDVIEKSPPQQSQRSKLKPKSLKTKTEVMASAASKSATVTAPTRRGRLRIATTENLENIAQPSSLGRTNSSSSSNTNTATTTTTTITRRRQKM